MRRWRCGFSRRGGRGKECTFNFGLGGIVAGRGVGGLLGGFGGEEELGRIEMFGKSG